MKLFFLLPFSTALFVAVEEEDQRGASPRLPAWVSSRARVLDVSGFWLFAAFGCLRLLAVCGPSAWMAAGLPGMADGVSVGYARWVGVCALAWEGRAR
jgi:hypothetical protein